MALFGYQNLWLIAETAAEGAKAVEEKQPNPMLPVVPELIWGAATFGVLLVYMVFFGVPKIQKIMDERDAKIQADLNEAERAETEAEEAKSAYNQKLTAARAEAAKIIDAARNEALATAAAKKASVEHELGESRAAHMASVRAAKEEAHARIASEVDSLAVDLASAAIGKSLDKQSQLNFLTSSSGKA